MIVVLPALTPVTTPSALTVAIASSFEAYVNLAVEGTFFTVNANVAPVLTSAASLVILSPAPTTLALAVRVLETALPAFLAVTLTIYTKKLSIEMR